MLDRYPSAANGVAGRITNFGGMGNKGASARPITRETPREDSRSTVGPEANAPSSPESPKPAKSPKADAPLRRVGRVTIASAHAAVLIGIVGLLLWYLITLPSILSDRQDAVVTIVAESLYEIRAPYEGEFWASEHMPNGTPVAAGAFLGEIRCEQLDADIRAAERTLQAVQQRKLLLQRRGVELAHPLGRPQSDQEFRQCVTQIVAVESELERLRQTRQKLRICSPIGGKIHDGFSGSKAVKSNDTVAYVWPDEGALLVEVKAPLKVIHELIREGRVEASFSTAGGEVPVAAEPINGALRVITLERGAGKKKELWGVLQCRPLSIPDSVAYPGPIGVL